jgi:hypothetical protein
VRGRDAAILIGGYDTSAWRETGAPSLLVPNLDHPQPRTVSHPIFVNDVLKIEIPHDPYAIDLKRTIREEYVAHGMFLVRRWDDGLLNTFEATEVYDPHAVWWPHRVA